MSTIFGVDLHPGYQPSFNFAQANRQGYKFAIIKASQGASYVPAGFSEYFKRTSEHMKVAGFYHFLERGTSGASQAEHFLNVVNRNGGAQGRLLAADFEDYGNRDPSNEQLKDFVRTVKAQTNNHAVFIYSTVGFWYGGIPSGNFEAYGADAAWEARVWYAEERRRFPKLFYRKWLSWYQKQNPRGLGGHPAEMLQFTWGGNVGGLYVDTDAFRGSMDDLMKLTTRTA
ncbi:MAG: glycoside hydrolase family 25 protein [Chloroflexota bacterium]|nr:glycoside hydrolase family 25 protein [Chloroflexota bacterium]